MSRGATTVARAVVPSTGGMADPLSGFFAVRREIVTDVDLDPVGYKILLGLSGELGGVRTARRIAEEVREDLVAVVGRVLSDSSTD